MKINELLAHLNRSVAPYYLPDEQENLVRRWAKDRDCKLLHFSRDNATLFLKLQAGNEVSWFTIGLRD